MADIELVIKISEEDYKSIKEDVKRFLSMPSHKVPVLYEAVSKGILLPKEHGRLIDADKLKTHFIGTEQGTDLEVYLESTIIDAPTIIKADKEE